RAIINRQGCPSRLHGSACPRPRPDTSQNLVARTSSVRVQDSARLSSACDGCSSTRTKQPGGTMICAGALGTSTTTRYRPTALTGEQEPFRLADKIVDRLRAVLLIALSIVHPACLPPAPDDTVVDLA